MSTVFFAALQGHYNWVFPEVEFVEVDWDPWFPDRLPDCWPAGGTVVCDLGDFTTPGQQVQVQVTITVRAPATSGVTLTNTATMAGPSVAPTPPAVVQTRVVAADPADIRVAKSSSPESLVNQNEILTYTINVFNDGPNLARDVVVTDRLPGGVEFLVERS